MACTFSVLGEGYLLVKLGAVCEVAGARFITPRYPTTWAHCRSGWVGVGIKEGTNTCVHLLKSQVFCRPQLEKLGVS